MKKIAVVLSGCGVFDGSEIHETICTLLAIEEAQAQYFALAPNILQTQVINHATQQVQSGETRNVLEEAARLVRGKITDIAKAQAQDYDALIFPGGFGAASNLCDYAEKGAQMKIHPQVLQFAQAMHKAKKPMGFICIAPVMIPQICGEGTKLTIGNDPQTIEKIQAMGGVHIKCEVEQAVVDEQKRVVSTPAYMLAQNLLQAQRGIQELVKKVLAMI